MATNLIKMQIQFRRDTAANWELHKDVIPAAGEPCFIIDKNILKIGDGKKHFWELEPINGVKFEIAADGKSIVLEDNTLKLMGYEGAEVGAQPIKTADGIQWVVPSTEVVDNLQKDVESLQKSVKELTTNASDLQTGVDGLKLDVVALQTDSTTLLGKIEGLEAKVGTGDDTIDEKIDAKINAWASKVTDGETIDTFKELIDYVVDHGGEFQGVVNDITDLRHLVGSDPVKDQITAAIDNSGHMSKVEAENTLLSKVEAKAVYEKVKYEITNTPVGTLIDYRDKEIRVMVPANAEFVKQTVGDGGDANTYYVAFKTYAPDNAVGYIEHLGNQVDSEVLTDLKIDAYGRKYQPTWLGVAKYDETSGWTYYGKNSTAKHYIGWDYQIDWYDANGIVISSDSVRINLSNETCHTNIEPFYMKDYVKGIKVNGTLLDMVDGIVDIAIHEPTLAVKGSDEIDVAEDGTLSIKAISFDKIVQNPDTIIVMDGGSAV